MTHIISGNFKKLKSAVTTHSSVQATSNLFNTFVTLNGSEITYTPDITATNVAYEISFYGEKINNYMFLVGQLEIADDGDTNWSEINAKYRKNFGHSGSSSQSYRWYISWRFVVPTWSGSKQLRIRIAHPRANDGINLHKMTDWDGSSATDQFCNTNLLVYSI